MSNIPIVVQVLWILAIVVVGIALSLAPIVWIARRILAPIDSAAKFRQAPVRFSIGDFLCLFLAIQIPLAGAHRFIGEETVEFYWTFTIVTWLVAPVIWFVGARTLSKAQVTTNSHRFVFLGLIMPLVYYGLIPFTLLGLAFLAPLVGSPTTPFRWILPTWFILATLFFLSGRFVQRMLQQVPGANSQHRNNSTKTNSFEPPCLTIHRPHQCMAPKGNV